MRTTRPRPHPHPRVLLALLAVIAILLTLAPAGPASAQRSTSGATDAEPSDLAIRLACAPAPDGQRVIGCRWSPGPDGTAGYQVLRHSRLSDRVETIARVGADTLSIRDDDVRRGIRNTYLVRALSEDGRQLAHSRRVTTGIPVMRLECRPLRDAAEPTIGCAWSAGPANTHHYEVLRHDASSDETEIIARVGLDQQRYRDGDVEVGVRYTYLVRAVTEDGRQLDHTNRATTGIPA